ncbi:SHOCT domain-containing protein [Ruminococcus bicirculans (ex Wegman et al. 2014)]|uniref:SHOCT domain-containing protein n=2 Tax=Ruminococcus TaxID=1263 RepID=UPI002FB32F5C
MWIIWIIVAAVIGTVIYEIYKSKKQNNEYENSELGIKYARGEYRPTSDTNIIRYMSSDEKNHLFTFGHASKIYRYDQLVHFELIEDNETIFKSSGSIGRAIAGGALAGGIGALIGSSTASRKSDTKVRYLGINATINPGAQLLNVTFFNTETSRDGIVYTNSIDTARKMIAQLQAIQLYNEEQRLMPADEKVISIPEQIKEYKSLLDCGAITQEEYDIKKKELLKS